MDVSTFLFLFRLTDSNLFLLGFKHRFKSRLSGTTGKLPKNGRLRAEEKQDTISKKRKFSYH